MAQQDLIATWKPLYLTGGIAALLAVFVFRRNLGAELSLLAMLGMVDGVPTTPLTLSLIHILCTRQFGLSLPLSALLLASAASSMAFSRSCRGTLHLGA